MNCVVVLLPPTQQCMARSSCLYPLHCDPRSSPTSWPTRLRPCACRALYTGGIRPRNTRLSGPVIHPQTAGNPVVLASTRSQQKNTNVYFNTLPKTRTPLFWGWINIYTHVFMWSIYGYIYMCVCRLVGDSTCVLIFIYISECMSIYIHKHTQNTVVIFLL